MSHPALSVAKPTSQPRSAKSSETKRRGCLGEKAGIFAAASCSREYAQLTATAETSASTRPMEICTGRLLSLVARARGRRCAQRIGDPRDARHRAPAVVAVAPPWRPPPARTATARAQRRQALPRARATRSRALRGLQARRPVSYTHLRAHE